MAPRSRKNGITIIGDPGPELQRNSSGVNYASFRVTKRDFDNGYLIDCKNGVHGLWMWAQFTQLLTVAPVFVVI